MKYRAQFFLLLLAMPVLSQSAHAELTPEMLAGMAKNWNEEVIAGKTLPNFEQEVTERYLASLDEHEKQNFLEDLRVMYLSHMSFEVVGEIYVQTLTATCGEDVVAETRPFFEEGDFDAIEPAAKEAFIRCAPEALELSLQRVFWAQSPKIQEALKIMTEDYGIRGP